MALSESTKQHLRDAFGIDREDIAAAEELIAAVGAGGGSTVDPAAAVADVPVVAGTPASQAFGEYEAVGTPSAGQTVTVTFAPMSPMEIIQVITFVSGAPINGNQSSLSGDPVQNLANTIAALFTPTQLGSVKTGPTTVRVTVGSEFTGASGNGAIQLKTNSPGLMVTSVDPIGLIEGGADAVVGGSDLAGAVSTVNALLASLRAANLLNT